MTQPVDELYCTDIAMRRSWSSDLIFLRTCSSVCPVYGLAVGQQREMRVARRAIVHQVAQPGVAKSVGELNAHIAWGRIADDVVPQRHEGSPITIPTGLGCCGRGLCSGVLSSQWDRSK